MNETQYYFLTPRKYLDPAFIAVQMAADEAHRERSVEAILRPIDPKAQADFDQVFELLVDPQ